MVTNDIETNSLFIRSTREKDAAFCLSIWLDEEMGQYMIDPPKDKVGDETLNFAVGIETQEGWYPFVAFSKKTGERVGTCSVVPSEDNTHWDLGYSVHKKFWRQGYATEMANAMIAFGQRNGGCIFHAEVAQANEASNALLRKLGFSIDSIDSYQKRETDIIYDSYIYRLDRTRKK